MGVGVGPTTVIGVGAGVLVGARDGFFDGFFVGFFVGFGGVYVQSRRATKSICDGSRLHGDEL